MSRIKDQLIAIKTGLADWAKQEGALVDYAHDTSHLLRILGDAPGQPRVGILFRAAPNRDEQNADVTGMEEREIWVAISRGFNLESYKGKSLVEGIAGGKPIFELAEDMRDVLRALRFDEPEPIPYYLGILPLEFEGVTLDALYVKLMLASDIGDNTATV